MEAPHIATRNSIGWPGAGREGQRDTLVDGELEARPMGHGSGSEPPCYNVQSAADAATGLIVHHEVMASDDPRQLYPMAKATKECSASQS